MACSRGVFVLVLMCYYTVSNALESDFERGFNLMYKTYKNCEASGDVVPCLKAKALKLADRALKINTIPIFDGLNVVRNEEADARSMGVAEFDENALPVDAQEKENTLDNLIVDRVSRFLKTHSLQFSLPAMLGIPEDATQEGRGKNKYMRPLIMAALVKGGLFAYATKAVGILAAKALLVSKIALVLASIVAAKKLFSSGHAESKTIEIVQKPQISHSHAYSGGHDFGGVGGGQGWETSGHGGSSSGSGGSGGYARSFDTSLPYPEAQELAYRNQLRQ